MPDTGFRTLHITDYASAYEGAFIRQLRMLNDEIVSRSGRPSSIALLPSAQDTSWAHKLRNEGWLVEQIPPSTTKGSHLAITAIEEVIKKVSPDVVHVHFGTYDLAARAAVLRLKKLSDTYSNLRLVWHYRTALETPVEKRSITRRIKDYLKYKRGGRDVDLVVSVTKALAHEAAQRGIAKEKSIAVVAGCDTDRFNSSPQNRTEIRKQLGVADDEIMLLHLGWHWHRKGGDLLALAVDKLNKTTHHKITAFSVGAPNNAELGEVHSLAMTDEIQKLHQAADIFVSASRSEGFGNGLIEAMACEKVAVAACSAGQVETFASGNGVIPIAVDSSDKLAEAINQLISNRDNWEKLGKDNREHVLKNHSMRRWASEMCDTYENLCPNSFHNAQDTAREVA